MSQPGPFTCPLCGRTSANSNDVDNEYCGNCHLFIGDIATYLGEHGDLGSYAGQVYVALGDALTLEQAEARLNQYLIDRRGT